MSLRDDFKEGDIVWAEWDDVPLRSCVGMVDGIFPPDYMRKYHERNGTADLLPDECVMVRLPGYVAPRGFAPWTQCRPATEEEKVQYFKDVLRYGR